MKKISLTLVSIAIALTPILSVPAYAYLDPATGSIILQALIAGIAGALLFLKIYWGRTKAFFQRLTKSHPEKEEAHAEQRNDTDSET